jgi:hypothetical protein
MLKKTRFPACSAPPPQLLPGYLQHPPLLYRPITGKKGLAPAGSLRDKNIKLLHDLAHLDILVYISHDGWHT